MRNLRDIVVGMDFSQHSKSALLAAKRLAQDPKAKLHLIHVVEDAGLQELAEGLGADLEELRDDSLATIRGKLASLASEAGIGDAECNLMVRSGDPCKEINGLLSDVGAGLLVLGSRGTGRTREGAGQMAIRCIRKTEAKVLLVRRGHTGAFKAVGAFVDFSKRSESAAQQAAYVARLHLFHVYLPPWRVVHYGSPTPTYTSEDKERHREKIIDKMRKISELFGKECRGTEVEYSLIESSEKIIGIDEFIEGTGVDLVVIRTRPRTGLRAVLLRTIAEHIIRTSPCSVLAVKS